MERRRAARVLGVAVTATPGQVHEAFRRRAREVHPDISTGDESAMVELNAAYRTMRASGGPDWEFVTGSEPSSAPDEHPFDGSPADEAFGVAGERSLFGYFGVAVAVAGLVMTTLVFIAAVGYDWSLSP